MTRLVLRIYFFLVGSGCILTKSSSAAENGNLGVNYFYFFNGKQKR